MTPEDCTHPDAEVIGQEGNVLTYYCPDCKLIFYGFE